MKFHINQAVRVSGPKRPWNNMANASAKCLALLIFPGTLFAQQQGIACLNDVIAKGKYSNPVMRQTDREGMDCSKFVLTKDKFRSFVIRSREIAQSDLRLLYSSRCELEATITYNGLVYKVVINAASTGYVQQDKKVSYFGCLNHCRDIFDFGFNDPVEGEDEYLKSFW